MKKEMGDIIKERRIAKGFTQEELSQKIGLQKSAIAKYENGRIQNIKRSTIQKLAEILETSPADLMGWGDAEGDTRTARVKGVRIPVLGNIVAGVPVEAIEVRDEDDWEEIHPDLAATGDFFALRVKGASMEPKISEGDVVIVRRQPDVDSGSLAVVLINGNDATLKKVTKHENGIVLTASNPAVYEPHFYTREEVESLPVQIIGKVVELRAKFE